MEKQRTFLPGQSSLVIAAVLAFALMPVRSGKAREKWPRPTEAARLRAEAFKQHQQEVLRRIEPELKEWAKRGKPFFPAAAKPGDLPQADVPAFPTTARAR